MIRRTTWILIGLLAAAVVGALAWTRRTPPAETDLTPTPAAIWEVDSASIQSIRLEDAVSGSVVEVERNPEEAWHLVQPTPGPADAGRVERSAAWLALPRPAGVLRDVEDLAAFGLDEPAIKIVVVFQDGSRKELNIGHTDPTGSVVYVQEPDSRDILLIRRFGLDEVLGLLDPIPLAAPTATSTPAETATPAPAGATPEATTSY